MKEPSYTDEENPIDRSTAMTNNQPRSGGSPIMLVEDEEDLKKIKYYHEMAQVNQLTRRIYFQCLILLVAIGVGLTIFATHNPYKTLAPLANDILCVAGIVVFVILSFLAFLSFNSENAQLKLILIIMISIFSGLLCGFLVALKVTVETRPPLYNSDYNSFYENH